jgi:tripartite-type tricarboxylate transporter receptor subunit TctC
MNKHIESRGVVVCASTPQELTALIRKDLVLWRKVVKDANIKPD